MPVFIIAEIGINHNGDVGIAKELIRVAKEAGCDAVKFQKRTIDLAYTKEFLDSPRESPWGTTQRAQKEALELSREEYEEIDHYCHDLRIEWFASVWDLESLNFLRPFDLSRIKVPSAMVVYPNFLRTVAAEGKHTYISTGMCTLEDIDRAVQIFRTAGTAFELMHCVSTYPMRDEDANLQCIPMLRERYQCPVGYSGHEVGLAVSYGAAALGISSLERHITLDRAMYGSDQAASVEPAGLRMLVGAVHKIEAAMGDGVKRVLPGEADNARKLRGFMPVHE